MVAKKTSPTWTDVKAKLVHFDRDSLLVLVQHLYTANKDNQIFLHARFNLGGDVLKPYKATISRWVWPDVFKDQDYSVTKAKKAISDYKKAIGQAEGVVELMVFYCECVTGFSNHVGIEDENYLDALIRMFEQALKAIAALPEVQRDSLWARLDAVRNISHNNFGYGVSEDMDDLLAKYRIDG